MTGPRIVIVGASQTGATAAQTLREHGFELALARGVGVLIAGAILGLAYDHSIPGVQRRPGRVVDRPTPPRPTVTLSKPPRRPNPANPLAVSTPLRVRRRFDLRCANLRSSGRRAPVAAVAVDPVPRPGPGTSA